MRSFSSNIGTLLETVGKKSKAAAIAARVVAMGQAAVNTAVAATKAYEVGMSAGFPVGLVLGPAAAIAAAIAGGIQIAAIASQKFAGGGIVGGNSYSGDKIPAQLNSGEVVFNSRQQAELLLNLANGGGRGGPTISVGGDTIIVNGSADRETIKAIRKTRQDQLLDLRSMLKELSYYGMAVA
jgi:hypothetical protein